MRVSFATGIAAIALMASTLMACDGGTPAPAAVEPAPTPEVTVAAAPKSCDEIARLAAAMSEDVPFASLQAEKARLGDIEIDDTYTTSVSPAGGECTIGKIRGSGPGAADTRVVRCSLFISGPSDRAKDAVKAKAAFDAARDDLEACLPKDWTHRDGSQVDADTREMMIFESAADAKRAMDGGTSAYPVQLVKEWQDGTAPSGFVGWSVTLNFQKEGPAKANTNGQ